MNARISKVGLCFVHPPCSHFCSVGVKEVSRRHKVNIVTLTLVVTLQSKPYSNPI